MGVFLWKYYIKFHVSHAKFFGYSIADVFSENLGQNLSGWKGFGHFERISHCVIRSEVWPEIAFLESVCLLFISLNYIKQLRLKGDLRLSRGFFMETLRPHEHDIPLVRRVIWEDPMFSDF